MWPTGEVRRGAAGDFHARSLPATLERALWWFEVAECPALVLGSSQQEAAADLDACSRAGVDIVRRRSGGGAVLLWPGESVWLDVLLPHGDPLWLDDVGRAVWWLGEVWAATLGALGADAVSVHRGPMLPSPWTPEVCFAGTGPGEVLDRAGRKLVGISQRRTRAGARFQCLLHLSWQPERYERLLSSRPPAAHLADVAACAPAGVSAPAVREAFLAVLRAEAAPR